MSKRVILTWLKQGEEQVEEVTQMDPTDPVSIQTENGHKELPDMMHNLMRNQMLVFEDDESLFMLPKEQIVKIEDV